MVGPDPNWSWPFDTLVEETRECQLPVRWEDKLNWDFFFWNKNWKNWKVLYNPSLFPQDQDACPCLLKCRIRRSPITLKIHISNSVRFLYLFIYLFLNSDSLKLLKNFKSDSIRLPIFFFFKSLKKMTCRSKFIFAAQSQIERLVGVNSPVAGDFFFFSLTKELYWCHNLWHNSNM